MPGTICAIGRLTLFFIKATHKFAVIIMATDEKDKIYCSTFAATGIDCFPGIDCHGNHG